MSKTTPTPPPPLNIALINASTKGGVQKTANSLDLLDMMTAAGHRFAVYDGDPDNSGGIAAFLPDIQQVSVINEEDLYAVLTDFSARPESFALIDLPGAVTSVIGPWLKENIQTFERMGISINVLLHLTADRSTAEGAANWAKMLRDSVEYFAFCAQREGNFILQNHDKGKILAEICRERVMHIPKLAQSLLEIYRGKRVPKSRLVADESLPSLTRIRFEMETKRIWQEITPNFEAITGLTPPPTQKWPKAMDLPETKVKGNDQKGLFDAL